MSLRIVCPHCEKVYVLGDALRGKKVRCKECQKSFVIRDAVAPDSDEPNLSGPMREEPRGRRAASRPAEPREDEDEERLPRRRKVRRHTPARRPTSWLVGGVVTGVVLVGALVGGLLWALKTRNPPATPVTSAPPATEPIQDDGKLLEHALAELDRVEPGWRMADLQGKRTAIPDQNNSALQVRAAKKLLPTDWPRWPIETAEQSSERVAQLRQEFEERLNNHPPTEELTAAQVAALRAELHRAAAALAAAGKLVDMPAGRFPIDWSGDLDKALGQLLSIESRHITQMLRYDAMLRAHAKDYNGALASCRAGLNAGRSIGDEHTYMAQLIRIACRQAILLVIERVLNQGEAPEQALAALQARVEEDAEQPLLRYALPGERAFQDWFMQAVQEGRKSTDEVEMQPNTIKRARVALLRLSNQCVEIARLPVDAQRPRIEALAKTMPGLSKSVQLGWMSFEKIALECRRSQAEMYCAAVALALERYRHAHQRWPTDLSELVPAFLPKVPLDTLDGKPLRYRRLADHVVVYSVGHDGKDDGGMLDKDFTKPGTDRGVRLWDVPHRRQQPR